MIKRFTDWVRRDVNRSFPRLRRWLFGTVPPPRTGYAPNYYVARRGAKGRGPLWFYRPAWRREILAVLVPIESAVRMNAPLPDCLLAAAREQMRLIRGSGKRLLAHALPALACVAVSLMIALAIVAGWDGEPNSLGPIVAVMTCVLSGLVAAWRAYVKVFFREAVFYGLCLDMQKGRTLSEAMARQTFFFPVDLIEKVRLGEQSDTLSACLDRAVQEARQQWRGSYLRAGNLVYLSAVLLVQVLLVAFILDKVVPVFDEILYEFEGERPSWMYWIFPEIGNLFSGTAFRLWRQVPAMDTLAAMMGFMQRNQTIPLPGTSLYIYPDHVVGLVLAILLMLALVGMWFAVLPRLKRSLAGGLSPVFAGLLLLIPGLRHLILAHVLKTVTGVWETLIASGMTLEQTVRYTVDLRLPAGYRRDLQRTHALLLRGTPLAEALERSASPSRMPVSLVELIRLGERSGMLPETLYQAAEKYRSAYEVYLSVLSGVMIPAGVLLLSILPLLVSLYLFAANAAIIDGIMP